MRITLRPLLFLPLLAVSALLGVTGCESRAGRNDTARVTALDPRAIPAGPTHRRLPKIRRYSANFNRCTARYCRSAAIAAGSGLAP